MQSGGAARLHVVLRVRGLRCDEARREVERCRALVRAAEAARLRIEAARDALQSELGQEMTRAHERLLARGARGGELDASANYTRHLQSRLQVAEIDLVRAEGEALRAEQTLQRAQQHWRDARVREERTRMLLQHAQRAMRHRQARVTERRMEELDEAARTARGLR